MRNVEHMLVLDILDALVRHTSADQVQRALDQVRSHVKKAAPVRRSPRLPFAEAKRRAIAIADPDELTRYRARKAREE